MKFNVPSKSLYAYVSAVNKIISSKNTLSILNNFLFTLAGDTLTITACDLENSLVGTITVADAEGEGKFCIDARRLVELLKEMPDQGVTFEINDENLAICIKTARGNFNLIALNGEEYPLSAEDLAPKPDEETIRFSAPAESLLSAVESTIFAVGSDELRPQMMGILWDIEPESLTLVATDTRKLVKYADKNIAPGATGRFILPVKPASVFKNVFGKSGDIDVLYTPRNVVFSNESFSLTCALINGRFPDYNRVIPQNNPYVVTIDRQMLVTAVRRLAVFVEGGNRLVRFKFTPEQVVMRASDSGVCANGREEVPCQYSGPDMVIGFGADYLLEIFNAIKSEEVLIKLADKGSAGVFMPAETDEGIEQIMLLMPMTVVDFED